MDRAAGLAKLTDIICDCLDLEAEEVDPNAKLISDLGADSLDIIDLIFTIEDAFDVTMRGEDFDLVGLLDLSSPDALVDGNVNPEIVAQLRAKVPDLVPEGTEELTPLELFDLITVDALWRVVEMRLAG